MPEVIIFLYNFPRDFQQFFIFIKFVVHNVINELQLQLFSVRGARDQVSLSLGLYGSRLLILVEILRHHRFEQTLRLRHCWRRSLQFLRWIPLRSWLWALGGRDQALHHSGELDGSFLSLISLLHYLFSEAFDGRIVLLQVLLLSEEK